MLVFMKRFLLLALTAHLVTVFPPMSQASTAEEEALYRAINTKIEDSFGDEARLQEAALEVRKLKDLNPNSYFLPVALGQITFDAGRAATAVFHPKVFEVAYAYYDQAIERNPQRPEAYFNKAIAALNEAQYVEASRLPFAEDIVRKYRSVAPSGPRPDYIKARLLQLTGEKDQAEALYRRLIQQTQEPFIAYISYDRLTDLLKQKEDFEGVEGLYAQRIERFPKKAWAYSNFAHFLARRGDYERAIELGEKALSLMDYSAVHLILADAYFDKANAFSRAKDYRAAQSFYERSLRHNTRKASVFYGLGLAYYQTGHTSHNIDDIRKAREAFDRALAIDPSHADTLKVLKNFNKLWDFLKQKGQL